MNEKNNLLDEASLPRLPGCTAFLSLHKPIKPSFIMTRRGFSVCLGVVSFGIAPESIQTLIVAKQIAVKCRDMLGSLIKHVALDHLKQIMENAAGPEDFPTEGGLAFNAKTGKVVHLTPRQMEMMRSGREEELNRELSAQLDEDAPLTSADDWDGSTTKGNA